MGLFDDGGNGDNPANTLIEQQMQRNEAEIESKRQSLYRERLAIIKSQGQQVFTPDQS